MPSQPPAAGNQERNRADLPTVIWHSLLLFFLILAFVTGLRIANDNAKGGWREALEPLMLQGDVIRWHAWAAVALTGLVAGYVAFLAIGKLAARWKVSKVLLKSRVKTPRWQSLNRSLYWLGLACFVVATVTGVWLYFLPFFGLLELVGRVHDIASWSLVAYLLLHVLAQYQLGGLWQVLKIFIPRRDYKQAGSAMVVAALAGAAGFFALEWQATSELKAAHTEQAPILDGKLDDAIWQQARSVHVMTSHGWNTGGDTLVEVKAAIAGERIYFAVSWPDTTRSYMRLPLKKTEAGWMRMTGDTPGQTYDEADTTDYYEDKFAIAISDVPHAFGGSWHFGPDPLPGLKQPLQGRGYHFTDDGSVVDLWHWKATRTGATGQAEDSLFGPPVAFDPEKHQIRYSAGYASDRKDAGSGYQDNFPKGKHGWQTSYPSRLVTPLFLPKNLAALEARLGHEHSPFGSHDSEYNLGPDEVVPYSKALDDQIPVGTVIPGLFWDKPITGPAGDVSARGHWENGRWGLEFSRQIAAPDNQDVSITDGVYLWFSAFDHNQTRHSWHVLPIRLRITD